MSSQRQTLRRLFLTASAFALIPDADAHPRPGDRAGVAATPSPFLGEWELDLARMPDTYGPPPKRVTYRFEDVGSGMWRTSVEIVGRDDSVRRAAIEYRRDGRAVPSEGDLAEADHAALDSPAPNVLVMSMARDNGLQGVRVYAISADGRDMTESAAAVDADGAPFVRNFHFRRIR